jgi:hypothetical protein
MLVHGTLEVETIHGRRGQFNVGKLATDVGVFKIKDIALDQYNPGSYSGSFMIEKISAVSTPWRGGFFTEIVAKVAKDGFLINQEAVGQEQEVQTEPDPLDTEKPFVLVQTTQSIQAVENNAEDPDQQLFGLEIYQDFIQRKDIALDPTVDRGLFRLQRDRLKHAGYRFDSQTQLWKTNQTVEA